MKQEVQTVSNCGLPVRKKFCPNVVKSNRLQKKDSKQINNSLTSDLKPGKKFDAFLLVLFKKV